MQRPPKLVVLSLDGVPHGLANRLMDAGHMPALAGLCERHGRPRMMRSVFPTVSCVAWASYATGRNPGKHGVFGFVDRRRGSYDLTFPNAASMRGPNVWEILSDHGKRVFGMNVPTTYPPRAVNGILIGGFLAPSLEKVAYPPAEAAYLRSIDYRIDSDSVIARESKKDMLADLAVTLANRNQAMLHYLSADCWDFFHTHVMGTDRINHFLLAEALRGESDLADGFYDYYRKVDGAVASLLDVIGDDTPLMILSDHGFCPIKYEVQLSRYLVEKGWTTPAGTIQSPLSIDPAKSRAFCLIPGRVYVNLRGREGAGCVAPEEYDAVRAQLTRDLLDMLDPNGEPVIRCVVKRENLYWPAGQHQPDDANINAAGTPPYDLAADLIAIPHDGYDLKMGLSAPQTFLTTQLEGMHTAHDAMILTRGIELPEDELEIRQLAGPILDALDVPAGEELDLAQVPAPQGVA